MLRMLLSTKPGIVTKQEDAQLAYIEFWQIVKSHSTKIYQKKKLYLSVGNHNNFYCLRKLYKMNICYGIGWIRRYGTKKIDLIHYM